jgi:hypothetical protein
MVGTSPFKRFKRVLCWKILRFNTASIKVAIVHDPEPPFRAIYFPKIHLNLSLQDI